jgi:hypothetical protein
MFNQFVKDPCDCPPKRGRLDRGQAVTPGVLELVCAHRLKHSIASPGVFCANFLIISALSHSVKLNPFRPRPLKLVVGGVFLKMRIRFADRDKPCSEGIALRKISKIDQQNSLEPLRLVGDKLPVMQWLVLCRIPNRGSRAYASHEPTNQLPTSLIGQAIRPPGGSTALLQLSKSTRSTLLLQLDARPNRLHLVATFKEYQELTLFAS